MLKRILCSIAFGAALALWLIVGYQTINLAVNGIPDIKAQMVECYIENASHGNRYLCDFRSTSGKNITIGYNRQEWKSVVKNHKDSNYYSIKVPYGDRFASIVWTVLMAIISSLVACSIFEKKRR